MAVRCHLQQLSVPCCLCFCYGKRQHDLDGCLNDVQRCSAAVGALAVHAGGRMPLT